ncbi:MAG: TIGR02186 family protein [Rhodospirillales bacterium]
MRYRWIPLALLMVTLVAWARPGNAAELVASLSNHLVAITTGFTGSSVLLFGATDGDGDVVVVVRGPEASEVVRRKARRFGIWMNDREAVFDNVPGFYAVASSQPLPAVVPESLAAVHQIGVNNLRLIPRPTTAPPEAAVRLREALIRSKQRDRLYGSTAGDIRFLGNRLFRTDMWIPANAPVGTYSVSVYLVRDGDVVSAEITPLVVSRVGFEARVFDFAHRYSAAYGILAILIAAAAGWVVNVLFRKG